VGGGKLEAKAIALAQELLAKNENRKNCQLIKWNLTKDVGMTCGGVVSLVFEVFAGAEWQIAVFGAGHVAQELVPLVTKLDCRAHCVDSRRDWLDKIPDWERAILGVAPPELDNGAVAVTLETPPPTPAETPWSELKSNPDLSIY
jgi:xanthine dehydrogenase accessory factor